LAPLNSRLGAVFPQNAGDCSISGDEAKSAKAESLAEGAIGLIEGDRADKEDGDGNDDDGVVESLVSMIQMYKDFISPLMGPNCRFFPTCSSYGIESIREFGPAKGLVLTAWRIIRCNPFCGKGVDMPQWPPPSFFAGQVGL